MESPQDREPRAAETLSASAHEPVQEGTVPVARPPARQLPAHRIALRAIVLGAAGGLTVSSSMTAIFRVSGEHLSLREVVSMVGIGGAATATALAVLVLCEELARRLRPGVRLAAVLVSGSLAAALITIASVWLGVIVTGGGPEAALTRLADLASSVAREPIDPLLATACALLDVLALGASRLGAWPGRPGWIPRLRVQAALAAGAGLLGFLLACTRHPPQGRELLLVALLFTVLPASASLGLALGERLEVRLLAWIGRLRARG